MCVFVQELPSYPVHASSGGVYQDDGGVGNDIPFTIMEVRLMRQVSGFGFRIIGGEEEGSQVQTNISLHACVRTYTSMIL